MKRTVYTVQDTPRNGDGDVFESEYTFEINEAFESASEQLYFMTKRDKSNRVVSVVGYSVEVGEGMSAKEAYTTARLDDVVGNPTFYEEVKA